LRCVGMPVAWVRREAHRDGGGGGQACGGSGCGQRGQARGASGGGCQACWCVLPRRSGGRWSGCRQRGSGGRCARMRAEGVRRVVLRAVGGASIRLWAASVRRRCVGFWGSACSASSCGQRGTGMWCVGVLGSACPALGCRRHGSAGSALGGGGIRRAVPRTRGGRRWGPAPDPRGSTAMDNLGAALRRELVVLVQKKAQSSNLKLMNSVLWGRNSWKVLPRPWCSLLVTGESKSHLLLLP
jgi:hypothetical protein